MFTTFATLKSIGRLNALRFTNTVTAALVAVATAMTCTPANALPMITFENIGATSDVFEVGGTFTLGATLNFDADDPDTRGFNVIGTSFDLAVRSLDGLSSFPDFTLEEVVRPANAIFDFPIVEGSNLGITMNSAGTSRGDLGALTLTGAGVSSGPVPLGRYTFALAPDAVPGEYELLLFNNPIVTIIDGTGEPMDVALESSRVFRFAAVIPEPATASLFVALCSCVCLRRRR